MKRILSIICLVSYCILFSQTPKDDFDKYKNKYKDYPIAYTLIKAQYNIDLIDNKLSIVSQRQEESIVLQDLGKIRNRESIHFSNFRKVENVTASTLNPEKKSYAKIPVTDFSQKAYISERNFHDDNKQIEFYYPNLELGSKKELSYQTAYTDPNLMSGFSFFEGYPIEQAILEVTVDKNVELGYKLFNSQNKNIQFSSETKGDKTIYKWKGTELFPFKAEEDMIAPMSIIPYVELYIKSYTINNKKINVLNDIGGLYNVYKNYLKDVNKTADPSLKAKVNEIIAGKKTEEEKVKAIYYWVKDNIKYISFEEGYDGFIPRNATDVYKRKYGDCKDMTSILYQMLKEAGIQNAYYTWIGSREKPFSYYDIPTMIVDDHMICSYQNAKNQLIFLDATSSVTPYGIPTSFIQGKEALIGLGETYKIVKVPVLDGSVNKISENIILKVDKSTLSGKSIANFNGYNRDKVINSFGDKHGNDELSIARGLLQKGSNKFILHHFDVKNKDNRDLPLVVGYDFNLDDYSVAFGEEIFVNLFLDKPLENTTIDKTRENDIEKDFTFEKNYSVTLEIPQGYKAGFIPKNDSFQNGLLQFDVQYTVKPDAIVLNYKVKSLQLITKKSEFAQYNEAIKRLKANYDESVSIVKK